MECVASTLHTTSEHDVSSITTADAHTSAASSRLKWSPRRFKWTRPFRRKMKSGFYACAITFQTQSTTRYKCFQYGLKPSALMDLSFQTSKTSKPTSQNCSITFWSVKDIIRYCINFQGFHEITKDKECCKQLVNRNFSYFWPLYSMIWYKLQMMVGWSAGWYDVKTALRRLRWHWNCIIHWRQTYLK
jgi:hypothetical protein